MSVLIHFGCAWNLIQNLSATQIAYLRNVHMARAHVAAASAQAKRKHFFGVQRSGRANAASGQMRRSVPLLGLLAAASCLVSSSSAKECSQGISRQELLEFYSYLNTYIGT